jgi:hypothetical protein
MDNIRREQELDESELDQPGAQQDRRRRDTDDHHAPSPTIEPTEAGKAEGRDKPPAGKRDTKQPWMGGG